MVKVEDSSQVSSVIPYQLNKKESTSRNTVKEKSETTSPSKINPSSEGGENGETNINASSKNISGLSPEEPPAFFKTKNMGEDECIKTIIAPLAPPPQAVIAEVDNIDESTPNATITTPPILADVPNLLPPVRSREITNKKTTTTTTTTNDSPETKTNTSEIPKPKPSSLKKTNAKNSNNNNGGKRTFTATVTDYDPQICDGFLIEAAVACFVLKGEDRYTFVTNSSEPMLDKVQSMTSSSQPSPSTPSSGSKSPRSRNKQKSTTTSADTEHQQHTGGGYTIGGNDIDAKLVAFAGVFDGHDGEKASQYCSRGILHHILAETNRVSQKVQKEQQQQSSNKSSGSSRNFFGGSSSTSTSNAGGASPSSSSHASSMNTSPATTTTSFKKKSRTTFFGSKANDDNNQSTSSNVISKNSTTNKDINIQVLKQGHVNGYTWAQSRFGSGCHPPTWDELLLYNNDNSNTNNIQQIRTGTKTNAGSFFHRLFFGSTSIRTIRGGTTATTIALYSKSDDSSSNPTMPETIDEEEANVVQHDDTTTSINTTSRRRRRRRRRPVLCALVACAGDSRCITDDGGTRNAYGSTNLTEYRAVTKDHRPNEPEESRRIQKLVRKGICLLQKDDNVYGTLRLYPGGLAVSRTVGDVQLTEAAIPTPEVFTVPLNFDSTKHGTNEQVTYRFVIASDGLWDVYDTDAVGRIVSQDIIDDNDKETNIRKNNKEKEAAANNNNDDNNNTVLHDNPKSSASERKRRTPKQAAKELLDSCIKQGGYEDDVTILVIDISLAPSSSCTSSTDEDKA